MNSDNAPDTGQDPYDRVVARERAAHRERRRRRARRALRIHTWIYLAVNLGLVAAWMAERLAFDGSHPAWWLPVAVGWGVGLAAHAAAVHRPWRQRRQQQTA